MSTRSPGRRTPAAVPGLAPAAATGNIMIDLLADCGREQFAMCMEASGALSRGLDAMRAIQQRTAQETAERHQAAALRLRDAAGAGGWTALPWTIWQDDLAGAARYWQELAAAALEAQTEVLGCACGHMFDSESALHGAAALEVLETIPAVRTLVNGGAAIAQHALPR